MFVSVNTILRDDNTQMNDLQYFQYFLEIMETFLCEFMARQYQSDFMLKYIYLSTLSGVLFIIIVIYLNVRYFQYYTVRYFLYYLSAN